MDIKELCNQLVEIGNESLDFNNPLSLCYRDRLGREKQCYKTKENYWEFHKKNPETGKMEPDPRVIEIGEELNRIGGYSLMRKAYYEVGYNFAGSLRALDFAWEGIGRWLP